MEFLILFNDFLIDHKKRKRKNSFLDTFSEDSLAKLDVLWRWGLTLLFN